MNNKAVAIIGYGVVGRAMYRLFPDARVYDVNRTVVYSKLGRWPDSQDRVNACDVAFVCVPTDGLADGSLDTSIVEEVVSWLQCPLIVIRSTVMPGTCDRLAAKYGRRICCQPEYLGETTQHPFADMRARPFLVIGGEPEDRRTLIELYQHVYNAHTDVRQLTNLEAEVCKLSENRAIAWRVMAAHELYEACTAAGVDYHTVRQVVYGDDPRFNLWFTWADPDNLGFGSSRCLSKDVPAWCAWATSAGYNPALTRALVECSEQYGREREGE